MQLKTIFLKAIYGPSKKEDPLYEKSNYFKDFIYSFLERGEGREKEGE